MNASDFVFLGLKNRVAAPGRNDGQMVWTTELPGGLGDGFVTLSCDDRRVFACAHGQFHCLDLFSGQILWRNELKGYGYGIASICLPGGRPHPPRLPSRPWPPGDRREATPPPARRERRALDPGCSTLTFKPCSPPARPHPEGTAGPVAPACRNAGFLGAASTPPPPPRWRPGRRRPRKKPGQRNS